MLRREPGSVPALGNLGVTYSRMERYPDAIGAYRKALALAPGEPGLLLNLAIAFIKTGDYDSAKPLLEPLPRTTQTRELLATCELSGGQPQRALDLLDGLPPSPEVLFLGGTAHLRLHQPDEARAAFGRLLASAPPARAHLLLGRAYAQNALFDEALAELRQAVDLDPASIPGRLELAQTLISLRDNDAAAGELRAVLATLPSQPDAAYYLGALEVQQGRVDAALPLLEIARAARPAAWGAYYYLGRAWMEKRQPARAVGFLETASKLAPGESAVWFQLARAWQSLGRADKAREARSRHTALSEKSRENESRIVPLGK